MKHSDCMFIWWTLSLSLSLFSDRFILHPGSGLIRLLCEQGQDPGLQRYCRASVERSQSPPDKSPRLASCPISRFKSPSLHLRRFPGVWDRAGGLPVPADPVLWEVFRQKHAQQGRQRDCGQDHGQRAGPGEVCRRTKICHVCSHFLSVWVTLMSRLAFLCSKVVL